jgi:3-oxoacyl-[acyl-carrier protein] reductase
LWYAKNREERSASNFIERLKMFKNKIVLITGGSSGIGEATALLFAKNGADVVITYKSNKEGAERVINQIKGLGQKGLALQADLISEIEAKKVVDEVMKNFGSIDILVNNAGRYIDGDEWNGPSEIWSKSLQQNLISMMNISKYEVEIFLRQKSGIMVNVASRHGLNGWPDIISYSAAKAGVINITQTYAKLLAPFGRANVVSPWAVNCGYWLTASKEETEATLIESGCSKLIEPETIAQKIVFLASDEAKNINGQNFLITG